MKEIYISRANGEVVFSPSILTFSITVNDNFNISKVIQVQDGEIQKTNDAGELLYLDSENNETIESKTITEYEDEEPTKWIDNEPVMVPNIVEKVVTFVENLTEFDVTEILKAKYQNLLDSSEYDYIIADIFLSEDDLDLEDKNHSANTGVAIMEILPHGQVKTKEITLNKVTSDFNLLEFEGENIDIYVNDVKMNNNKVKLEASTNKIYLKFTNTTDKAITIKSYAIAY